ncbi:hypothetical protein L204_103820 [Cryptococcus depauperatus]|nr:DASH complex subunit DAD2 [Cryptococcus depauperatus CBS 7855]
MPRPSTEPNLPPSLQTYYQKQQEYAGLQALREASANLVQRAEKLAEMSHIMANGGEAIGEVMKNWPHVFSVLNLFTSQMEQKSNSPSRHEGEEEQGPLPCLVRLPYGGETSTTETSQNTSLDKHQQ